MSMACAVLVLSLGVVMVNSVGYEGEALKMKLDHYSGAGFSSKSKYMFGKVTIQIKLVEGDSAGTVTAFYMSSDGPNHNEFDFEFLGNTTGEPYLVQTNVYVNGVGNREQRLNLWFDPTKDFHSYSILWNQRQVVTEAYPTRRTNPWACTAPSGTLTTGPRRGGRVKTDWTHAPFVASYKGFHIDACECLIAVADAANVRRCGGEKAVLVGRSDHVGAEPAPEPPAVVGSVQAHGVRLL
ncbi:xyloglucan endotransglucosylase/hydrolase 9 [Actinidia rufa]|uniref:Xyloglucan endotransglucosylase/hydrolase 9 n=1 Tax=Actinidia rufa TaxID=165716 RepID=A0A7J0G490_9ERIC|nr:xyloglucan endotransglucosylase/hydrolase 9 [Actinidia rufa]